MKRHLVLTSLLILLQLGGIFAQVGTWTQKSDFNAGARQDAISFSIGDKGYICAGQGGPGLYYQDVWEYDLDNDTWTQKADLPGGGRNTGSAFTIGNKAYAGIGALENATISSDFYEYDSTTNSWTQKANYPGAGKLDAVGFSIEDKGYFATGRSAFQIGNETNDFWEYNPQIDVWSQKAFFAGGPRDRATAFSIGSRAFVGTGYFYDGTTNDFNDLWEYNPNNDSWEERASLPSESRSNAVSFAIGDKGFLGIGYLTQLDFWQYDPNLDTWTQMAYFGGQARLASVAFSAGNRGYIGLGYYVDGSTTISLNDIWEYENEALSVSDYEIEKNISIVPNPVINSLKVHIENSEFVGAVIYNLSGREILSSNHNRIDVSQLSSGVYFLEVVAVNGTAIKRFVKK